MAAKKENLEKRPPVVAIMGHVDHGKSSLLDYVRKSNVVAGEAGGITQHISAYEVVVPYNGTNESITFLDTPGHAAFSQMRHHGAAIADIAILIISATESVKPQTAEAISIIQKHEIPFIVAISKIDLPGANIDTIKSNLLEYGIYVEGYGGNISAVPISAKTGQGIDELLQMILLHAEIEDFLADSTLPASGFVLESHSDPKCGISATLVIKNGSIELGDFIVSKNAVAPTRIVKNFLGKNIESAKFSSPIVVSGFNTLPKSGNTFQTFKTKKEAEVEAGKNVVNTNTTKFEDYSEEERPVIPLIIKTDVAGTIGAVKSGIEKLTDENIIFKIVRSEVGDISEADINLALGDKNTIILGFGVKVDPHAKSVPGFDFVRIKTFDIIYKLFEWLESEKNDLRLHRTHEITQGEARIVKVFSSKGGESLIGAKVEGGSFAVGEKITFFDETGEIAGRGKILSMKIGPGEMSTVGGAKTEFGAMVSSKTKPVEGWRMLVIITESE